MLRAHGNFKLDSHRQIWRITNAMVALLGDLGGKIETGVRVNTASQLPPADVTMFDLAPGPVAGILGDRLPGRTGSSSRVARDGHIGKRSTVGDVHLGRRTARSGAGHH